jgi:hypothetical protein
MAVHVKAALPQQQLEFQSINQKVDPLGSPPLPRETNRKHRLEEGPK